MALAAFCDLGGREEDRRPRISAVVDGRMMRVKRPSGAAISGARSSVDGLSEGRSQIACSRAGAYVCSVSVNRCRRRGRLEGCATGRGRLLVAVHG